MNRAATSAALAGAALAVALALPGAASAAGCSAPDSGARACLAATWTVAKDDVTRVQARVTLLRRVERCRHHGSRRATALRGTRKLGTMRATATCSHQVVRWTTVFTRADTEGWPLRRGDVLTIAWGGTSATASVALVAPAKTR